MVASETEALALARPAAAAQAQQEPLIVALALPTQVLRILLSNHLCVFR